MAIITLRALAAQRGVTLRTAQRWAAAALRDTSGAAYPVVGVTVPGGQGARIAARAMDLPDEAAR